MALCRAAAAVGWASGRQQLAKAAAQLLGQAVSGEPAATCDAQGCRVPWVTAHLRPFSTSPSLASTSDAVQGEEAEDAAAIERFRSASNFRRRLDGRVLLHGKQHGWWMEAKLDGYVEGSMLLRAPDGAVFYLVSEDLKQIDLSNDQLLSQLFKEGTWEGVMQPLYSPGADGGLKQVVMTPAQFRSIFTVLKAAPPAEDGPAQ